MAFLVDPSDDDVESYAFLPRLALEESPLSADEIGDQAFVEMLQDGARQACINYHESNRLTDAIAGALSSSPVNATPVNDWTLDETNAAEVVALSVVDSGMQTYCPSIAPILDGAAEEFMSAWFQYIGAEPLERERWIFDGVWEVGVNLEAGTYRNSGSKGCYWERLSGFSGDSSDRIASGYPDGDPATVTIQPSDAGFYSEYCGRWVPTD